MAFFGFGPPFFGFGTLFFGYSGVGLRSCNRLAVGPWKDSAGSTALSKSYRQPDPMHLEGFSARLPRGHPARTFNYKRIKAALGKRLSTARAAEDLHSLSSTQEQDKDPPDQTTILLPYPTASPGSTSVHLVLQTAQQACPQTPPKVQEEVAPSKPQRAQGTSSECTIIIMTLAEELRHDKYVIPSPNIKPFFLPYNFPNEINLVRFEVILNASGSGVTKLTCNTRANIIQIY